MAEASIPNGKPKIGLREWLFNPFRYVAGVQSLVIGIAAIFLAGLISSVSNTHFDGVLDFHTGVQTSLQAFAPLEGPVDWLSLAVVLFLLGRLVSRSSFRAIDLFGTQAMARWPMLLAALATLAPQYRQVTAKLPGIMLGRTIGGQLNISFSQWLVFGIVLVVSLATVVWMVALMYRSYSLCCNLKGARAILSFIGGLLAAEVISKVCIYLTIA